MGKSQRDIGTGNQGTGSQGTGSPGAVSQGSAETKARASTVSVERTGTVENQGMRQKQGQGYEFPFDTAWDILTITYSCPARLLWSEERSSVVPPQKSKPFAGRSSRNSLVDRCLRHLFRKLQMSQPLGITFPYAGLDVAIGKELSAHA
jgi:hypothetical protein